MTGDGDGLIASLASSFDLLRTLEVTEIVCVQNSFSLADRTSLPVLHECVRRDIAFVPLPLATTRWHNLARYSANPSACG